jgi:hypothetical protein
MPDAATSKGVVDALTNTYTDVAKMQLLPDAQQHMQFLDGLQQGIMHYIQMQASATTGPPPAGGAGGMGGMGGGMGAGPGAGPMGAPPGMGMGGGPDTGGGAGPPAMATAPGGGAGMTGLMGAAPGGGADALQRLLSQTQGA